MVIVVLDNPLYYLQSARKESEGKSAARLFAHTHLSTFFKLAVFFILLHIKLMLRPTVFPHAILFCKIWEIRS